MTLGSVLVVDDDATVGDVVRRYLERAGHDVRVVTDGESALRAAQERPPDLVVLDLMLPGVGGLEVCRRLRANSNVSVIMLTALGEESDRILGLQQGADDYVVKPFSPRELVLRIKSVLRRAAGAPQPERSEILTDGDLRIDTGARRATVNERELLLTAREFDLLVFLVRNEGTAYSREQLLSSVWGWDFGDHSTVTVHVRRLREKIEATPAKPVRLATVWGVGYRYDRQR
jgi:DNA-binding response OmpR family regulator